MAAAKGVIVPMVTPLLDEDTLDLKGCEKLLEHLIKGGVHGVFILGTTGEGPSLKQSLQLELIQFVCGQVAGRVPVLVGVMGASFKEAARMAASAEEYGAYAVVVAPPIFYQISQDELYGFTNQLIREISLPVYLYNNPGLTKVSFGVETIEKLIRNPQVIGIKDSSADMSYYNRLLELTRPSGMPLLMGPEELLMESVLIGGGGGVPGGGNAFPELFVKVYESAKAGKLEESLSLQREVMKISRTLYSGSGYGSSNVINGIKCALKHLDICNDYLAQPLQKASPEKEKKIRQFLSGS